MPSSYAEQYPYLGSYYPAVDGLRTVAVLAVFLHHSIGVFYPHSIFWWGWCGVDLFFVISGFLITGILVDSRDKQRFFTNFYIRRSLRIFPLFYSLWIGVFLLAHSFPVQWHRACLLSAAYLWNLVPWLSGAPSVETFRMEFAHFFGHTLIIDTYHLWSLSIEEQFYLLWPLVVSLLSIEQLMIVCAAAIALVPWLRLWMALHPLAALHGFQVIYTSTFTRFDSLLAGGLLALWLRSGRAPSPERVQRYACILLALCAVALVVGNALAAAPGVPSPEEPFIASAGYTLLAGMAVALVALAIHPQTMTARWLSHPVMLHLAHYSYGFYVLHYLLQQHYLRLFVALRNHGMQFLAPPIMFALAYGAARLSYHLIEQPFLRLKSRMTSPQPQPVTADA